MADKAEEYAYSVYPEDQKGFIYDIARNNIIRGYEQAEKDLALTWKDVRQIILIHERMATQAEWKYVPVEQFYTEVLKRFLERKKV